MQPDLKINVEKTSTNKGPIKASQICHSNVCLSRKSLLSLPEIPLTKLAGDNAWQLKTQLVNWTY